MLDFRWEVASRLLAITDLFRDLERRLDFTDKVSDYSATPFIDCSNPKIPSFIKIDPNLKSSLNYFSLLDPVSTNDFTMKRRIWWTWASYKLTACASWLKSILDNSFYFINPWVTKRFISEIEVISYFFSLNPMVLVWAFKRVVWGAKHTWFV